MTTEVMAAAATSEDTVLDGVSELLKGSGWRLSKHTLAVDREKETKKLTVVLIASNVQGELFGREAG